MRFKVFSISLEHGEEFQLPEGWKIFEVLESWRMLITAAG
jgi:hypothetical protein